MLEGSRDRRRQRGQDEAVTSPTRTDEAPSALGTAHHASYWRATAPERDDHPLLGERDADVVVVGGGIVGSAAALLAAEAGLEAVVLEARELASGTTGGTTGKVTSQNGTRLGELRRRFGVEGAQRYAGLTTAGIARLDELIDRYAIDCDREVAPAHLVSLSPRRDRVVEQEAAATQEAGLTALRNAELPEVGFPVRHSLTIPHQLQVHAVKLVHGLADAVTAAGGSVHTWSRVVDVGPAGDRRRWQVTTPRGVVTADHVVLATRLPTHRDALFTFARTKPVSAVGLAGPVAGDAPVGMYLFKADRDWSIRGSRPGEGAQHLVAVGMSESTGDASALRERGGSLADWTREHWPLSAVEHVWMAQDQQAADERPYIGPLWRDGIWTATGFGKWGLAAGVGAAEVLVARMTGGPDPADGFFSVARLDPPAAWPSLLRANLRVSALMVGDHLRAGLRGQLGDLAIGEGRVVRHGRRYLAVSRDADGALVALGAHCTHLGCLVRWNVAERTWDCGCHGSRFAVDGEVLEAPATKPLSRAPLD
jgi:glycine/D-amino acid oxidase-like deaminating enzyme/nitrite reductase/ring-hydroxylating ferredoxin subunit